MCLAILNRLYPSKNIIILQGKNPQGKSIIDQVSIAADTEIAQIIQGRKNIIKLTPKDFDMDFRPFKYIETRENLKKNLNEFIKLVTGRGDKDLEKVIAMEVSLNLYGLGIVNNLKTGVKLALDAIHSGKGIEIIKDLVSFSGGDKQKFNNLLNDLKYGERSR